MNKNYNYKVKHKNFNKFKVAFNGVRVVFLEESSFRYQFFILVVTVIFGLIFGLSKDEWMAITFVATLVFTFEIVNTAVENIMDLVSPDYNALVGKIKDITAASVLVATFGAIIIGLIIFSPKIINIF